MRDTTNYKNQYEDGDILYLPYAEKSYEEPKMKRCIYCEYCKGGHPSETNEVLCYSRNKVLSVNYKLCYE